MDLQLLKELLISYSYKFLLIAIILFATSILIKLTKKYLERTFIKFEVKPILASLLTDLLKFILWILALAAIFNILGLKEISLAMGGSIVVMGLGFSKSISKIARDLLAGFFLIIDEDFELGSRVSVNGVEGIVEDLDVRKTKIRDDDGNLYIVPNGKVDNDNILIKK